MIKTEFLQELYSYLAPLSPQERDEIIQDFEEHFQVGLESGKTEEQICQELGSPKSCAASYLQNPDVQQTPPPFTPVAQPIRNQAYGTAPQPQMKRNQNTVSRLLWLCLFVFFIICAFGVYPAALGLMASPIVIALAAIFAVAIVPSGLMICFLVFLSVTLFTSGLLMFLVMTWLLKLSYKGLNI